MTIKLDLMRNGKVKKTYESSSKNTHAEEAAFFMQAPGKSKAKVIKEDLLKTGNLEFEMSGWPCVNDGSHNCHGIFLTHSATPVARTIIVTMTSDSGGYKTGHPGAAAGHTTITYTNGVATYS